MRGLCASIFRWFFLLPGSEKHFFGVYQKVFVRYRLFEGVVKKVQRQGFSYELHIDEWIQANVYFLGSYESEELNTVRNLLKESDVFVDLGANIGLFSTVASRAVGPNGHVYSFEPFPLNAKRLKRHKEVNDCSNMTIIESAVADKSGTLTLVYDDSNQNTGMPSAYKEEGNRIEVPLVALDEIAREQVWRRVDFIKMDIEGGEYLALKGMQKTLTNWAPTILLELHPEAVARTPYTSDQITTLLTEIGYQGRRIGSGYNYLFQVKKEK